MSLKAGSICSKMNCLADQQLSGIFKVHFGSVYVSVCVSLSRSHRGQKMVSDPLELELEALESHMHGCKEPKCS